MAGKPPSLPCSTPTQSLSFCLSLDLSHSASPSNSLNLHPPQILSICLSLNLSQSVSPSIPVIPSSHHLCHSVSLQSLTFCLPLNLCLDLSPCQMLSLSTSVDQSPLLLSANSPSGGLSPRFAPSQGLSRARSYGSNGPGSMDENGNRYFFPCKRRKSQLWWWAICGLSGPMYPSDASRTLARSNDHTSRSLHRTMRWNLSPHSFPLKSIGPRTERLPRGSTRSQSNDRK